MEKVSASEASSKGDEKPLELSITSCEYGIKSDRPEIHIWGRDSKGIRHEVTDSSHHPYFYVQDKDLGRLPVLSNIGGRESEFTHLVTREPMTKLFNRLPKNVGTSKEILHDTLMNIETFESDVLFPDVYLGDKGIYGGIIKKGSLIKPSSFYYPPRLIYIDIETYSRNMKEMPNPKRDPITVIGIKDSYKPSERICFKNMVPTSISFEREMIQAFVKKIQEIDPDVIVGHWITGFDLPYIFERSRTLKVNINGLSPMKVVRKRKERIEILGREIFDTVYAYRIFRLKELEEEAPRALDKICKKELKGKGQLKFEGSFGEMWDTDCQKVIDRNDRDVDLVYELDQELGLFRHFDELRRVTGIRLKDIFHKAKTNDLILLRYAHKKRYVLSNRRHGKKTREYPGAFVKEPIPGIYENVVVLDYRGFYPALIILFNISPETWNPYFGDLRIDDKHAFNSQPMGIVPESLVILLKERNDLKAKIREMELLDRDTDILRAKSEAFKSNINAFYGNLGMPTSRVYFPEVAESATIIAQKYIFKLNGMLVAIGYDPFYNDTDASYIILTEGIDQGTLKNQLGVINSELPEGIEVEFQILFKKFLIVKKKRYAGRDEEGNIKIRGLEAVRTDTPELFSKLQRWVIEEIFDEKPKEEISSRIKLVVKNIKDGKVPWYSVGVPKGITMDLADYKGIQKKSGIPFHIQGILASKKLLNLNFGKGSKPRILPLKTTKRKKHPKWLAISEDTELGDLEKRIDREAILKTLKSGLEKILVLYEIKWESIVPKKQKTLEGF